MLFPFLVLLVEEWKWALVATFLLAPVAYFLSFVSRQGMFGGLIVGSLISLGTGLAGFFVLFTFFFFGSLFSKWKIAEKQKLGVAQENQGRRGARHALAKGGIPVLASLGAIYNPHPYFYLIFSGALATALSDTTSSELGQIYGKHPIDPIRFKKVPIGTEGAVSLEGTLLGILASAVLAFISFGVGLCSPLMIPAIILGAFVGTTIESLLGASYPQLNNEVINFMNTLIGGGASVGIYCLFEAFF